MHPRIRKIDVVDAASGQPDCVIQVIERAPESQLESVGPCDRGSRYLAADGEPLSVDEDAYVGEVTGRKLLRRGR